MQLVKQKTNMADFDWANESGKTCKIRQIFSTCGVKIGIFSTHFNQFCWKLPELINASGAILPDLAASSRCIGSKLWHVTCLVSRWAYRTPKSASLELLLHFLFVWAQTLQDGKTLYSKKIVWFLFFDFNGFWRENDVTRLTQDVTRLTKFQDMAKQINNLKRARRDRIKLEIFFEKRNWLKSY